MTKELQAFPGSDAAQMLAAGLKEYSSKHKGGLRGLATQLGIKQATVLSHMANGRMTIPLNRVRALAEILGLDLQSFALAVLRQRAPELSEILAPQGGGEDVSFLRIDEQKIGAEKMHLIKSIIDDPKPVARRAVGREADLLDLLRERRPLGLSEREWRQLFRLIEVVTA